MIKINKIGHREEGFASIIIALTMIVVLALLVVGFAQLARREQQSALDKQLSAQAYYAAETGINDMRKLLDDINNGSVAASNVQNINQNKCLTGAYIDSNKDISSTTGVSYTCAIVNTLPKELKYTKLLANASKFTNFQATDSSGTPVSLKSLTIKWVSDSASALPPSGSTLYPFAQWTAGHYPSLIQFALTPYLSTGSSRSNLIANTATTYLYPSNTGGSVQYSDLKGAGAGTISKASCNGSFECTLTVSDIPAGSDNYLIQFINMYVASDVTITGKYATGPTTPDADIHFKGAQTMIDITGRARNVLKRLQVRIPQDSLNLPSYVLEAQNICKRVATEPNSTTYSAPSGTGDLGDSCKLESD